MATTMKPQLSAIYTAATTVKPQLSASQWAELNKQLTIIAVTVFAVVGVVAISVVVYIHKEKIARWFGRQRNRFRRITQGQRNQAGITTSDIPLQNLSAAERGDG
ncbi:MAG: hypothetical protein Q9218_008364, partial [Villophora microphyllina]